MQLGAARGGINGRRVDDTAPARQRRVAGCNTCGTSEDAKASWAVEGGDGASFRCFRVLQPGKNAGSYYRNSSDHLCCAGIELYGVLTGAH